MKKILFFCLGIAGIALAQQQSTPHDIIFYFIPCVLNPACAREFPQEKLMDIVTSHETMGHEILKGHLASPLVQGIYVTYLGYITFTDYNGQIMLPNKEHKNELTVVVTNHIYPVMEPTGNTVNHFQTAPESPADFYLFSLTQDEKDHTAHWHIKKIDRPASGRIPRHALVILAQPHDVEIQQGTFATIWGPHFILPDVYVHTHVETPLSVLRFIKNNRFFEPLVIERKFQEQSYSQAPRP